MIWIFYISSAVAVLATALVITRRHPVHALLYLIVSLLAVAMIFVTLGAPFLAALEVIIYAGAIMVLFVFVVMMLNVAPNQAEREQPGPRLRAWAGPALLVLVLLGELVYVLAAGGGEIGAARQGPREVGIALLGPYLVALELVSMLLLAALVGAYHLGRPATSPNPQNPERPA